MLVLLTKILEIGKNNLVRFLTTIIRNLIFVVKTDTNFNNLQ